MNVTPGAFEPQNPVATALTADHHTNLTPPLQHGAGFGFLATAPDQRSFQSMLQQFEVILSHGQIKDPRVILQAMNLYLMSHQQRFGIDLFSGILDRFAKDMTPDVRAIYEASLGVLRATHADKIPLTRRIGWVKDSFALIEQALARTQSQHPIPHWAAGMVYAQVPWFFFKTSQAISHLTWLADRPETEPTFGFYREVYRQLAHLTRTDQAEAEKWRALSGYGTDAPHEPLIGWFVTGKHGTAMSPRPVLDEIVPGQVFALYGFGFSDIYFVLSKDRQNLIAIDVGTHPRSIQAAHEMLLDAHPDLPKITAAFITHAHWDHIGGHSYLTDHNPDIQIHGRANYAGVTQRVDRQHSYQFFRGADFDHDWVTSYAPTHPVTSETTLELGGTPITLIPVTGGETEDAMLIHFPDLDCLFVGDVVMPWYGEPWVNEGFATTAPQAMDQVLSLGAAHILHGHHPLTQLYGPDTLPAYRDMHAWLVTTTQHYVRHGYSAKDIIRLNLVPRMLVDHPDATLGYVAARDNLINRVVADMAGIWREDRTGKDPEGLDTITMNERARMLSHYLGLSQSQTLRAIRRMIEGGDNALALQWSIAAAQAYGETPAIGDITAQAADRLRSIAQFTDPFGFTTYSEMTGRAHPPMPAAPTMKKERHK